MACTCVVLSKCVFKQLIFCSCVTVTLNYALVLKMANRFLELSGMALVKSDVLTLVKTGITFTVVSYFGDVTASLFALTLVWKFTPRRSKTIQAKYILGWDFWNKNYACFFSAYYM